MSSRTRRTAAAIALAAAVTALLPTVANAASTSAALNGTRGNALTISDGSTYVVMNGTRVNFGVHVRDLAWSPNGRTAAFIDGAGNLEVANANGTGRRIVAVNTRHQTWSHPTWQVAKADAAGVTAKNNIIFAAGPYGATRLESISATAYHGTPATLRLNKYSGDHITANPTVGNAWPSSGSTPGYTSGRVVYANSRDGEVYLRDDNLRQQGGAVVHGSEPALSPNGAEVAFVRSVGGHDHLFVESLAYGSTARDITPHATTNYTEPTWSPDGHTLAFRTPTGIDTMPANGSKAPVRVSSYTGLPAYRG